MKINTDKQDLLSYKYLTSVLEYSVDTGIFTNKVTRSSIAIIGDEAGGFDDKGYRNIKLKNIVYKAHRLAWFYVHKEWPSGEIDHIDRNKANNRIVNLRVVRCTDNLLNRGILGNNTSGVTGVSKIRGKWQARVSVEGRRLNLGTFDTVEEAELAITSKDTNTILSIRDSGIRLDSSSKVKGVNKKGNKWMARYPFKGNRVYLGTFNTVEEASSSIEKFKQDNGII